MSIRFDEDLRIFQLDTPNTSYILGIQDAFGYLLHYYYGKKLQPGDVTYLARTWEAPYTPDRNGREKLSFLDSAPMEYPTGGIGDFREHCLEIRTAWSCATKVIGFMKEKRNWRGCLPPLEQPRTVTAWKSR